MINTGLPIVSLTPSPSEGSMYVPRISDVPTGTTLQMRSGDVLSGMGMGVVTMHHQKK